MADMKVQSLDRAFDILEILGREPTGLTLVEIAAESDLPRSTTFRLLSVLLQRDYVRKGPYDNFYRLGPGFIELSSNYLNSLELKTESAPFMRELASSLGTIVFLARRQGNMMVYIDKEDQFTSLRKYAIIGEQRPIYCTSLGKALILDMDDDEIRNLIPDTFLTKFGPNTHIDVESLIKDIHICKARGWTHDNEEAEPGVNCVAAPIRDYRGQIIASISTSWLLEIRPELEAEKVALFVVRAANEISRTMGFYENL
ncbi:MAG: IclR family transcriptional regulator [Rectinema sp.]